MKMCANCNQFPACVRSTVAPNLCFRCGKHRVELAYSRQRIGKNWQLAKAAIIKRVDGGASSGTKEGKG